MIIDYHIENGMGIARTRVKPSQRQRFAIHLLLRVSLGGKSCVLARPAALAAIFAGGGSFRG